MHPFLDDAVWHARRYGCRVMYADLGGRNGQVHRSGLIKVNPDRNLIVQRETLLHEVGHWSMGHSDCMWNRRSDRREMAADKFAPDLIFSRSSTQSPSAPTAPTRGLLAPSSA